MTDRSQVYTGAAFVAGVLLALGFRDLYPELKQRLLQKQQDKAQHSQERGSEDSPAAARLGPPAIVNGIEGCIGNTPLLRIKSLSDETGCEILAKAEACLISHFSSFMSLLDYILTAISSF